MLGSLGKVSQMGIFIARTSMDTTVGATLVCPRAKPSNRKRSGSIILFSWFSGSLLKQRADAAPSNHLRLPLQRVLAVCFTFNSYSLLFHFFTPSVRRRPSRPRRQTNPSSLAQLLFKPCKVNYVTSYVIVVGKGKGKGASLQQRGGRKVKVTNVCLY